MEMSVTERGGLTLNSYEIKTESLWDLALMELRVTMVHNGCKMFMYTI